MLLRLILTQVLLVVVVKDWLLSAILLANASPE